MMSTPASAIKEQVRVLIDVQIKTFGQPAPLTSSQLRDYKCRSEEIRTLFQELDRIGTKSVIEKKLQRAS